jgi:hypothetical protein
MSDGKDLFMEQQSHDKPVGLLSSWKEIAAYLGVNVRTAQNWETDRGLPVRRLPGGRGRVVVSVDDLNSWLRAPAAAPPVPPVPEVPPATRVRPRPGWVVMLAAAFLLMLVVGGASLFRSKGVPAGWRVEEDALVVADAGGRQLWKKTFGYALTDYRAMAARFQEMGWIGDLDGDGQPEVVFLAHPKTVGTPMVYCYTGAGVERWRFEPGQRAARFPLDYRPPYNPSNLVVFRDGGALRLAVASVHHMWFPSQIALLSSGGSLLREYWHAGHLPTLAVREAAGGAGPLLYAGGVANGYHRAALVILDPKSFGGVSREEKQEFQLPGDPAREVARVLFPRSCINQAKETYNSVVAVQATPNQLLVHVSEEIPRHAQVAHSFRHDGRYLGVGLSSVFAARHNELQHAGLLDHQLDSARESAALAMLQWLTPAPATTVSAASKSTPSR